MRFDIEWLEFKYKYKRKITAPGRLSVPFSICGTTAISTWLQRLLSFRRADPFIVVDLLDLLYPEIKDILKIPGYNEYLHPLSNTIILGIGVGERGGFKIATYNIRDIENPVELSVI